MIDSAVRVLYPPSRSSFEQISEPSRLGNAILFAAAAGLLVGIVGALLNLFSANGSAGDVVVFAMFGAIRFVAALLVTQSLLFGFARTLGAKGSFERQAFLSSLFIVPLTFIGVLASGLNGIFPGVGYAIGGALILYQIVLTVPMLQAANGNDWSAPLWKLAVISVVANSVGALVSAVLPQ